MRADPEANLGRTEEILDLVRDVSDSSEALGTYLQENTVSISKTGITKVHSATEDLLSLRIFRNGRIGIAGTASGDLETLAELAMASSKFGRPATFDLPSSLQPSSVELVDPELAPIGPEDLLDRLRAFRQDVRDVFPHGSMDGSLSLHRRSFRLANSEGLDADYEKMFVEWNLRVSVPTGEGTVSIATTGSSGSWQEALPDPDRILPPSEWLALAPPHHPPGGTPVVLSPEAFSVLLQGFRAGVSGSSLVRGYSPLAGSVGRAIFSDLLTVNDRPLLNYGAASAPFDAEGTATRDKALVDRGRFTGFIFDLATASEAGEASTGNAGRNYNDLPEPVCTNLLVETGEHTPEEMLSAAGDCVLVDQILSGGTSNVLSGDFSLDASLSYVCRRGTVEGRAGRLRVTGNVYRALSRISMVGRKRHLVGQDSLPYVAVEGLDVF
ncbi:hypothetical protein GF402_02265 [Candidatus Fermentibacteria bacterium]|nr:hypothetical protein [Candidatus Fermentibacteria bacterium]